VINNNNSLDKQVQFLGEVYSLILSWPESQEQKESAEREKFGDLTQSAERVTGSYEPDYPYFTPNDF